MAVPRFADRVEQAATCTGTSGAYALGAVKTGGFRRVQDELANGDTFYYIASDPVSLAWETGLGTYNSGTATVARTLVSDSSTGVAINWTGTEQLEFKLTWSAAASRLAADVSSLAAGTSVSHFANDYLRYYQASTADHRKILPHALSVFGKQLAHFRHVSPGGIDGGTFTAGGWRTRTLNFADVNEISGASLSSSQITLPAGTYFTMWRAPAYNVSYHQSRLYNITNGTTLISGSSQWASNGTGVQNDTWGTGRFTLSGAKVLELQHRCSVTVTTYGFGTAAGTGGWSGETSEVYADILIWRIQ